MTKASAKAAPVPDREASKDRNGKLRRGVEAAMNQISDALPSLDRRKPPLLRRVAAVVNEAGGSVAPGAAQELRAILERAKLEAEVASVAPAEIGEAVRAAVARRPDLVITLAGDGTARCAAQLCEKEGLLIAPLAGGTMNLLPYALYGRRPWQEALESALQNGHVRAAPGGRVGGQSFYVAAILGAPALWAPAREAVRHGKLRLAYLHAKRAFARAFTSKLRFTLDDGPRIKAEALGLISPLMSDACVDDSALEAVALDPRHAADAFRIGFASLFGDWRADPAVQSQCCRKAHVHALSPIPCLLDGELHMIERDADIEFVAHAFHALVGADAPA